MDLVGFSWIYVRDSGPDFMYQSYSTCHLGYVLDADGIPTYAKKIRAIVDFRCLVKSTQTEYSKWAASDAMEPAFGIFVTMFQYHQYSGYSTLMLKPTKMTKGQTDPTGRFFLSLLDFFCVQDFYRV